MTVDVVFSQQVDFLDSRRGKTEPLAGKGLSGISGGLLLVLALAVLYWLSTIQTKHQADIKGRHHEHQFKTQSSRNRSAPFGSQ